jgi:hypothetical protein
MWVMLAKYLEDRKTLRPSAAADSYFLLAVRLSLDRLKKEGLPPMTMYSKDKSIEVTIATAELEAMRRDPYAPFK